MFPISQNKLHRLQRTELNKQQTHSKRQQVCNCIRRELFAVQLVILCSGLQGRRRVQLVTLSVDVQADATAKVVEQKEEENQEEVLHCRDESAPSHPLEGRKLAAGKNMAAE